MSSREEKEVMKILVTGGSGFIGTNYVDYALLKGVELVNIDIKPPAKKAHQGYYRECNIMNGEGLKSIVRDVKPTHVVHLAAKTGAHSITDVKEFAPNMEGVTNLIKALQSINTVEHAIFTSSLLVCKMGYIPKHDTDYMPTTAYGVSKVEGEKIVRDWEGLDFKWTIIRPISVWGPWMVEPYIDFFKAVARGWYMHIGQGRYKRSMGYVENIAHEIHSILLASTEKVDKKTFYVGDPEPTDLYDFAEEVRKQMGAPKIRRLPYPAAKSLAVAGDLLKHFGWAGVPLSSFRLNNIMTEYIFDLSPITDVAGPLPYDVSRGIKRSIEWLREMEKI